MSKMIFVTLATVIVASTIPMAAFAQRAMPNENSSKFAEVLTDHSKANKQEQIQQRVEEKKQAVKTKLTDKRLSVCKKREKTINQILDKRTNSDEKRLAAFDTVRDNLKDFTARKQLSTDDLTNLEAAMSTARQTVVDAIAVARSEDFSCEDTDGNNPGDVVNSLTETRKQALREYRESIRKYSQAVKAAATKAESKPTTTHNNQPQTFNNEVISQ